MDNIVTAKTAKRLKDSGFPQPEPKEGQFWYGLIQRQDEPIYIFLDRGIFNDRYGNYHKKEAFEKFGTYAPTATDILRELGFGSQIDPMPKGFMCMYKRMPYFHENPAEAAALAFLGFVENGGYSETQLYKLWDYLNSELGVIALHTQLGDIIKIVRQIDKQKQK